MISDFFEVHRTWGQAARLYLLAVLTAVIGGLAAIAIDPKIVEQTSPPVALIVSLVVITWATSQLVERRLGATNQAPALIRFPSNGGMVSSASSYVLTMPAVVVVAIICVDVSTAVTTQAETETNSAIIDCQHGIS